MKNLCLLLIALLLCKLANAQTLAIDSANKTKPTKNFTSVEQVPEFPGGFQAFANYLSKNIKYPEIADLIGVNGKVIVSFVVERDGKITNVVPRNCIGAGCESEAVKVVEMSPAWHPGIQNSKPVRVAYSVPINFSIDKGKVKLKTLRNSGFGFVFSIKDSLYTIDEAEAIIGKSFNSEDLQMAEPFYNYDKVTKFDMPDKKEVYLLIFKPAKD